MTSKELVAQILASLDSSIPSLGVIVAPSAEPGKMLLAANLTGGSRFRCNNLATVQFHYPPGMEVAARDQMLKLIHLGVTQSDKQRSDHNRNAARVSQRRLGNAERSVNF